MMSAFSKLQSAIAKHVLTRITAITDQILPLIQRATYVETC